MWSEDAEEAAVHTALAEWAEAIAVFPATMGYIARLAAGMGDTPSLLTIAYTRAPVVLAPSLPPNADASPILQENLRLLALMPNLVVAPTQQARSVTTHRQDAPAAAPSSTVIHLLEQRLRKMRAPDAAASAPVLSAPAPVRPDRETAVFEHRQLYCFADPLFFDDLTRWVGGPGHLVDGALAVADRPLPPGWRRTGRGTALPEGFGSTLYARLAKYSQCSFGAPG